MNKEEKNQKPISMVAPKSTVQEKLQPIDELAAERGMPTAQMIGMCRANGWADGKQLTATAFETAMTAYMRRPMGSGRI